MTSSTAIQFIDEIFEIKVEQFKHIEEAKSQWYWDSSVSSIKGLSLALPTEMEERVKEIFNRLKHHFEIGVLLKNHSQNWWIPQSVFVYARFQDLKNSDSRKISLPSLLAYQPYFFNSNSLLKKLNLSQVDRENKMSTVAIRVSPNILFCFLCEQANPWLKLRTETLLKEIINGMV